MSAAQRLRNLRLRMGLWNVDLRLTYQEYKRNYRG
jgi:hypothetical protein